MRALLPAILFLVAVAAAQEQAPAAFSQGLERLAALGLPPMKDAEWVKAPADSTIESFSQSYEFREMGVKLGGSAWMLPGDPAQMMGFGTAERNRIANAAAEKAEQAPEELNVLQKAFRNYAAKKEKEGGTPAPAPKTKSDLAEADVKLMTDALAKEAVRKELQEDMGYGRYGLSGRLLIFCAQLHAAGKTEPADRLAAAIFDLAPDKGAVIDAAISHFAEKEYEQATQAFFEKRDWAAYETTLKGLLAKYPRGWEQAGAVAMLMSPLEKRVKGEKPPTPSLPQIGLKPETLSALDEMLESLDTSSISDDELARANGVDLKEIPQQQRARYLAMLRQGSLGNRNREIWLLTKPKTGKDPAAKLKAMGMDGLIALAAVVTDETLTPMPLGSGDRSTHYYYRSDRSPEEIAKETFSRMKRPSSRGELAFAILQDVIPSEESSSGVADAETMRAMAVDFWKQHRNKSAVELAEVYLSSKSRFHRELAGQFLATHSEPAAYAVFEKIVLSSGEPAAFSSLVEAYLDARKEAGKPFFDAYAKQLREALPASGEDEDEDWESSQGSYQIKNAGGVEKYLKKLALKVGGVPIKQLLEAALKAAPGEGDDEANSPLAALSDAIAKLPFPEALTLIGEAAPRASTPQLMEMYGILLNSIYNRRGEGIFIDTPKKVDLTAEAIALWKPLLVKTDVLPEKGEFARWARGCGARTVGDGTTLLMEVCAFPASGYAFQVFAITGSPGELLPFVKARVEAWIAGKEPAPWPDAEKVAAERRAEIEAKLVALPVKEILPFTTTLSIDEKLWVATLVSQYGPDKEAPPALAELSETVIDLRPFGDSFPHDAALLERLRIANGWRIDSANLEKLAARMAGEAKEFSGGRVLFYQAPMGLGVIATASKNTNPETEAMFGQPFQRFANAFEEQGNPQAMVCLSVNNTADYWKVVEGKVTRLEAPEARRSALNALASRRESKRFPPFYIQVIALTLEDARRFHDEP